MHRSVPDPQIVVPCLTVNPTALEHHGLGAAAELMHASLNAAADAGGRGVWLGVNSQNARAIRFYEKSGFRKVGTKSFKLGSTVEHDFVLERAVP